MMPYERLAVPAAAAILLAATLWPVPARPEDRFRVVFSSNVFATVNRNDAVAATKAWIESVGRSRDLVMDTEVFTYETADELRAAIRDHRADLFIMGTTDYLAIEAEAPPVEPLFMPQRGDVVLEDYVLLERSGRLHRVEDLSGAEVLVLKTTGANLGHLWLESHLGRIGLGTPGSFFGTVQEVDRASRAVLPVFFEQAEACVVDRAAFEVMAELNPQVGTGLSVVASSPPYLESLICMHDGFTTRREAVIESLAELHEEPSGQQLMMVFKIDRLAPFDPDSLDSVRELMRSTSTAETPGRDSAGPLTGRAGR